MNPFIPIKRADTVIVAGNISDEIDKNLKELGLKVIKTLAHKDIHKSIQYHPDLVIHLLTKDVLLVEPSVFDYYKDQFKNTMIKLVKGEKRLKEKYPEDIPYNLGRVGNFAFHKFDFTDIILKRNLQDMNIDLINVNQGYSKCSMAIIGETDVITSDISIDKKVRDLGFNSLLIEPGHIHLEDQDYGFIGGCTGNISNKEVLISGNLDSHPDKESIEGFIHSLGKEIIYLSRDKIIDIGTIIALNTK